MASLEANRQIGNEVIHSLAEAMRDEDGPAGGEGLIRTLVTCQYHPFFHDSRKNVYTLRAPL